MSSDKRSLLERIVSGDVSIGFGDESNHAHEYAVELSKDEVWVHGCDCSARMDAQQAAEVYEALGAWLRIQRNRDLKTLKGRR